MISDLQKYHLSQTMVSSNRYVGHLRIPWIDSNTGLYLICCSGLGYHDICWQGSHWELLQTVTHSFHIKLSRNCIQQYCFHYNYKFILLVTTVCGWCVFLCPISKKNELFIQCGINRLGSIVFLLSFYSNINVFKISAMLSSGL